MITGSTTGVVGIKNVQIDSSANAGTGTVLISNENSVKLEGGTRVLVSVTSALVAPQSEPKK
jgi:hypothetical protein